MRHVSRSEARVTGTGQLPTRWRRKAPVKLLEMHQEVVEPELALPRPCGLGLKCRSVSR